MPFRISLGYNTEKVHLKTSKYERYTGAVNLSPKFFDNHLSVDINVKGTINKTDLQIRCSWCRCSGPTKPFDEENQANWLLELGNELQGHRTKSGDSESIVFIIR